MHLAFPARRVRFQPRQMVSSLRQRNYRLFFFGQLVSVAGTWMQTVAQSFLVLDLTHSGTQLGLTTAARFGPMFLFGPLGGVFADRMDKRRVLYVTQSLSGLLAAAFAVTVGTHEHQAVDRLLARRGARLRQRLRQPGAAELHLRDGLSRRSPERRHAQLGRHEHGPRLRRGAGRSDRRGHRPGPVLCLQRPVVRGRADLAGRDAQFRAVPGQARRPPQKAGPAGPALRAIDARAAHPARDDRGDRHAGLGVPGDAAADGQPRSSTAGPPPTA